MKLLLPLPLPLLLLLLLVLPLQLPYPSQPDHPAFSFSRDGAATPDAASRPDPALRKSGKSVTPPDTTNAMNSELDVSSVDSQSVKGAEKGGARLIRPALTRAKGSKARSATSSSTRKAC